MWLGYLRVSRVGDRAERLISPELQTERIQAYARVRGLDVEILPPELDVSGGTVERPVLSEAITRIEAGAEGIIVAQLDRLSRLSLADVHKVIERIESLGGKVIAVAENFDASTPEGEWTRDVFLGMGRMQLRRYSAQFRAAKERAVREGIWPFTSVPLGYEKGEDRRLVVSEDAPLIVRAFEARAAGESWTSIAKLLDCGHSMAGKTLRNPVYLGQIRIRFPDGEVVNRSAHEPIVERGLWESAQVAHPRPRRTGAPRALLAGLCRCEGCAGALTPDISKGRRVYRCMARTRAGCTERAYIAGSVVEPIVERAVLAALDEMQWSLSARTDALSELESSLEGAEAELASFQQVERVSDSGVEFFTEGMRVRIEAVEDARRRLAAARLASPVVPEGGSVREFWPELSVEERRHVLRSALSGVFVRKGKGPDRVRLVDHGGDEVRVPAAEDDE